MNTKAALSLLLALAVSGCGIKSTPMPTPSPFPVATATFTKVPTLVASTTPTPTQIPPSATPTPIAGIEVPIDVLGVDLKFVSVEKVEYVCDGDSCYFSHPLFVQILIKAVSENAEGIQINWPEAEWGNGVLLISRNEEGDYMQDPPFHSKALIESGTVSWFFDTLVYPTELKIRLPGGIEVDLSPLYP